MRLIVGLGNPGPRYKSNRHNAGYRCVSYLAKLHGIQFDIKGAKSRLGQGEMASQPVVLARPQTYMNDSGLAVKALLQRYRASPKDLLIIADDLDLPLGKIRIRPRGGSGGHKGLESIISEIDTDVFDRIRVGIGRPEQARSSPFGGDPVDYVLSDFTREEESVLADALQRVAQVVEVLLAEGIEVAMNQFNP